MREQLNGEGWPDATPTLRCSGCEHDEVVVVVVVVMK